MAWLTVEADRYEQWQNDIDTGEQISWDRATPVTEPKIDLPDVDGQSR